MIKLTTVNVAEILDHKNAKDNSFLDAIFLFSSILVCDILGAVLIIDSSYIRIISFDELNKKALANDKAEDLENALLVKDSIKNKVYVDGTPSEFNENGSDHRLTNLASDNGDKKSEASSL